MIEAERDTRLARMRARVAQQSATRPWRSPTSEQGIESEQEEGIESEQGIEQEEGGPRCPSCGARLEPRGRPRRRRVRTSGGQEAALEREYGVCAQCGQGLFPLDEELGLLPGVLTPRLQEQLAHLGTWRPVWRPVWRPFAPAAQMLARFTGIAGSAATARRLTEVMGRAVLAGEDAAGARLCDEVPPVPAGPERAVLSVDGALVPLVGGEWAEVKTLVVGEVAPAPSGATAAAALDVHLTAVSTCSRLADVEQFNAAVLGDLHRRGVEAAGQVAAGQVAAGQVAAGQVAAGSDGAEGIPGFIDLHSPQAIRILDFAPAAEHVALVGQARAPDDPTWLAPRLHRLNHEGPEPVLAELHQHVDQAAALAQPPPEVGEALTYLDKREALMQQPAFAAAG